MDVTATTLRALPAADTAARAARGDAAARAAVEFEGMFLGLVVNEMMKDTMPAAMNGGRGEEMFSSLLGEAIGASMARSGGVGIAASVERAIRAYGS